MKKNSLKILLPLIVFAVAASSAHQTTKWGVQDIERPQPQVVTPGATDNAAPSDAIVLFDGTNLSEWKSCNDGGEAKWKLKDGYMEIVPGTGDIHTRQLFGSCQVHIEWSIIDEDLNEEGNDFGNSGVFLMERYELQILDSYEKATYPDAQAGAIYGQSPPQVNVCKKPGQWQSYDIIFHAPIFSGEKVIKTATITVFHNGVLIQDNWEIWGATYLTPPVPYVVHDAKMPLRLQEHHHAMRYRNIWIRSLDD